MSALTTEAAPLMAGTPAAGWEPQIIAIACNWCTCAGADMAGTTRRAYPANVRVLRVPCSGRVNPLFLLKVFEQGADGVLVSGCHPGDCHYSQGNYYARRRFAVFRALLDFLGIDPRRVHFSWVSASEAIKWASVVEEVTEAVRAAGPLAEWGGRRDREILRLPDPPPQPREAPAPSAQEAVAAHLRELAKTLLAERKVETFLGYMPGPMPGQMVPAFVSGPEEAAQIGWSDRCFSNLATYLAGPNRTPGKLGIVVKACDARAVIGLLQEGQVQREDLVLVGVSCPGVWDDGRLALKCYACDGEAASICDYTVTPDGASPGAVKEGSPRATAADPRDAQIAFLQQRSPEERWAFWQAAFADCLRCYACRAVCPMCYCGTCLAEQHRPQWIPTAIDGRGNTTWNAVRAFHLTGRCAGCDECARVCPARLRLDLLNRRVALEVEQLYGYRAGEDPEAAPPLATFRADDPEEFIR